MNEEEWEKICGDTGPRLPPVDAEGVWCPKGSSDWPWPQSHVAEAESGCRLRVKPVAPFEIR